MLRNARFRAPSLMLMKMPEVQFCWVTWSKQPPAVVLVRGTLAVMAVARCLVVAGFAIHLKAVFGTLLRGTGAVFSQVTLACWRPANAPCLLELCFENADILMSI